LHYRPPGHDPGTSAIGFALPTGDLTVAKTLRGIVAGYRDGDEIGTERIADIGVVAQRLVIGLADQVARQRRMVEAVGKTMHHRIFQTLEMQHGRIDEGGQLRLAPNDIFRLGTHAIPDRIERRQFSALLSTLRIDLVHRHGAAPRFWPGVIARRRDRVLTASSKGERCSKHKRWLQSQEIKGFARIHEQISWRA